jgi:hypothetical protein
VTRWALAVLVSTLLIGAATIFVARLLGKSGSRASLAVSIVAHWLGAYVVWSFLGGLALHYGVVSAYDGALFALLALGMGYWQYVTAVTRGRHRGLVVFVGGQLAWLAILLYQNGVLSN